MFLDWGWLGVTKTVESETLGKGGLVYFFYWAPHTPFGDEGFWNCLSDSGIVLVMIEPEPMELIVLKELLCILCITCSFFLRALALSYPALPHPSWIKKKTFF